MQKGFAMKLPRFIHILIVLLVFALMAVSLLYIWFPEYISKDSFARVLLSFGVIFIGSALLASLRAVLPRLPEEKSEKAR